MRKLTVKTVSIFIAALFCAQSFASGALPSEPHLYVQGSAELQVQPDIAVIHVAITKKSKQLTSAKKLVDDVMASAIDIAKKHNVKLDNIHAQQLNIYRQTRYDRTSNQEVFDGFRVNRTLTLTLEGLEGYPALLQKLVDAGMNEINNTEFLVSNKQILMNKLKKAAVSDAKLAAKELSAHFDVELDGLYSASFSPLDTPRTPYERAAPVQLMEAQSSSVEQAYNTGAITLKANVYAVYTIKD